jgi:oxidase EvaA
VRFVFDTLNALSTDRFMTDYPLTSEPRLRLFCDDYSSRTTVVPARDGLPDWVVEDDCLRNSRTDYFRIGLYATELGRTQFLMEQTQRALVMLLVAEIQGVPAALLGIRTEPGLIGLTNLTATIQSTPSNYLRKHGGKATPFLEVASNPSDFGTVIHDGDDHDWGNYYAQKTKRFLIVRLDAAPVAPDGYVWVALTTLRQLLLADDLITNDLRVCLSPLFHPRRQGAVHPPNQVPAAEVAPLRRLPLDPGMVDAQGTAISFFRTDTPTREVACWVQPLLVPAKPMTISLIFIRRAGERLFAVERLTQPGLLGRRLWFPAVATSSSRVVRRLATSAEGGRFWHYRIFIELRESEPARALDEPSPDAVQWLTEAEVSDLVATPLCTSLELRLAWSLVYGDKGQPC